MLTQDDYKLYTGETSNLSTEDWSKMVGIANGRLASLLCLEKLPDPLPDDLALLLANFIAAMEKFKGNPEPGVASKSVRNFTISFTSQQAANVFQQVAENYGDIIDKYSACKVGLDVEKSKGCCYYGCF